VSELLWSEMGAGCIPRPTVARVSWRTHGVARQRAPRRIRAVRVFCRSRTISRAGLDRPRMAGAPPLWDSGQTTTMKIPHLPPGFITRPGTAILQFELRSPTQGGLVLDDQERRVLVVPIPRKDFRKACACRMVYRVLPESTTGLIALFFVQARETGPTSKICVCACEGSLVE
jgi:hypothetical protein